jgi:hypothetical protein
LQNPDRFLIPGLGFIQVLVGVQQHRKGESNAKTGESKHEEPTQQFLFFSGHGFDPSSVFIFCQIKSAVSSSAFVSAMKPLLEMNFLHRGFLHRQAPCPPQEKASKSFVRPQRQTTLNIPLPALPRTVRGIPLEISALVS